MSKLAAQENQIVSRPLLAEVGRGVAKIETEDGLVILRSRRD